MSYEFNPESPVFEFPNPYKVENLALFASGTLMLLAGVITMVTVRDHIMRGPDGRVLAVVGIAIGLLLFGIGILARAFTQLRFFFGRNRPEDLAPLVAPDQDGDSRDAEHYKETLRQNALVYSEPKGALNGLLYSWLPHLIFAPSVIQRAAQTQFYNFLALLAVLVSFLLCWFMFGQGGASGWIGLIYGAFGLHQIMRPMNSRTRSANGSSSGAVKVGTGSLVLLVVLAILGPVILMLVASSLPDLGKLSINGVLLAALVCSLIGCGAFGFALKSQLLPPPQTVGSARVVDTVTMNAHPNKLIEELDRILMNRWYSNIPNRRYTQRSPVITGQQGKFTAELFEESQPRPQPNRTATGIKHALSTPQFRWLTVLTALACIYLGAGTVASMLAAREILAGELSSLTLAFALSQIAVGVFCYRAAHVLWGRFDFVSELIWVDIGGSFESARVNIGNQISSNVHTTKSVINIEAMTMRVWVSEVDTVIFGKDEPRQLVGMRGLPALAEELATSLKEFSEDRSMVVAPNSREDVQRAQQIGAVNQLAGGKAVPLSGQELQASMLASGISQGNNEISTRPDSCPACGTGVEQDALYCAECGTRVVA